MKDEFKGKDLVGLLDMLEPVPEPVPVPLWPATPGAYLVLILLFAAIVYGAYRLVRHHRANAYRRAALREIAGAGTEPAEIARIIRRVALVSFPRADVAPLHGEAWLAFLDESYGGNGFREGAGRPIAFAPYTADGDSAGLARLAAEWVRRHRRVVP